MPKMTIFAHPRGWVKGEPLVKREYATERGTQYIVEIYRPTPTGGVIQHLGFTAKASRDQWVKWWNKK